MLSDHRIALFATGDNPDDWSLIQTILGFMDIPVGLTSTYIPASEVVKAGDFSRVGRGVAIATWSIKSTRPWQRQVLRAFCAGYSAQVYIRTTNNEYDVYGDQEYIDCLAQMVWPVEENIETTGELDLRIAFDIIEEL